MLYQFSPVIQAGIEAGKYIPVVSKAGVPLSIVRDAATGHFAANAIGVATQGAAMGINPLVAAPQLAMGAGQLYQGQMTLNAVKALSASVATLQATTAVIGVGVAVTGALVAVNLWQTLKLRKDVKQMRLEVQEGFLNLHKALADQGEELLQHIDQVAEDVEFRNHRTILVRAYGKFNKALNRLQTASTLKDFGRRNDEITAARDMLFDALADYDNHQLMEGISAPAYFRRRECVWAIEQAIAMTFQMQGEFSAVSDRLLNLDQMIRQDAVKVVSNIEEVAELDFFFPEIHRIHDHDLATIAAWQAHTDWYQELSTDELQHLNELTTDKQAATVVEVDIDLKPNIELDMPPEYSYYQKAQEQSHLQALSDSLLVLMDSGTRTKYEEYISDRAGIDGLSALTLQHLDKASPLTISNLLYYFAMRDETMLEEEEADELEEIGI